MPIRLRRKENDQRPITPERELVGKGLYTFPEAARVLSFAVGYHRPWSMLRNWTLGYKYKYIEELRASEPIIEPQIRLEDDTDVVTFLELVELLVIGALRKKGLSMLTIRRIQEAALNRYGGPYPFARRDYNFLGKQVFADLQTEDIGPIANTRKFSEEVVNGQLVLEEIVRPLFERCMEYLPDSDLVLRYWPLGRDHSVVMDPTRSFGKPIHSETGVPTSSLYSVVRAGDSEEMAAHWFSVPLDGVRDAIKFEEAINTNVDR